MSNLYRSRNSALSDYATIIGIILAVVFTILFFTWKMLVNRPGQTEERATGNMQVWLAKSGVGTPTRKSCSHDSDGDGYASCTVALETGEKIYLECVAGWWPDLTGASGCKEIEMSLKMLGGRAITNNSQTVMTK